jgi:hypothetical protein
MLQATDRAYVWHCLVLCNITCAGRCSLAFCRKVLQAIVLLEVCIYFFALNQVKNHIDSHVFAVTSSVME